MMQTRLIVINHCRQTFRDEDINAVVLFISATIKNNPSRLSRSSLQIFSNKSSKINLRLPMMSSSSNFYEYHHSRRMHPKGGELKKVLQSEFRRYSDVFVIVDALDECLERDRAYLITELQSLASNTHLMVTSRPLLSIEPYFQGMTCLQIMADDEDLRKFIRRRILRDLRLDLNVSGTQALQESILKEVVSKAKGMYVYPIITFKSLADEIYQ